MTINNLVILGPTATGKTSLSLKLSEYIESEIINTDTSIFYKDLEVGTGKPSPNELSKVKHHLVDFLDPRLRYSLSEFIEMSLKLIEEINSSKKIPMIVGGSSQYLKALVENWNISKTKPDYDLRKKLDKEIQINGVDYLYNKLSKEFPQNALSIDPKNPRRVIRAYELGLMGKNVSREKTISMHKFFKFGLTMPREILYENIDIRIENMIQNNWVGEVELLIKKGLNKSLNSFSSIGYNEIYDHLVNDLDLEEAIRIIKKRTRNLVRHQYNWFKLNDPDIKWFDSSKYDIDQIAKKILEEKIEYKI